MITIREEHRKPHYKITQSDGNRAFNSIKKNSSCRKQKVKNRQMELVDLSAAWPSGSECRFYDAYDRKVEGSTPTQASLLRIWIRCFTAIISAWWNLTSSKLKKSKLKRKTWKPRQLPRESGFVLCFVPPSLSRDRGIKMTKSE